MVKMSLRWTTSLSPSHRSSTSFQSIHTLALLFLTIKGVDYLGGGGGGGIFAAATHPVSPSNSPPPIPSNTYATPAEEDLPRICVTLCTAGFGGAPCEPYHCSQFFSGNAKGSAVDGKQRGQEATDQRQHPPVSLHPAAKTHAVPRRMVCGKLCAYGLGMPLCECVLNRMHVPLDAEVVCRAFCTSYGYRVDGCPNCAEQVEDGRQNHGAQGSTGNVSATAAPDTLRKRIDWNQWCKGRCAVGDGGAACNCDILPLNFHT